MPAAIDFQEEHGWDDVRSRCRSLARRARLELSELLGTQPLADDAGEVLQMATVRLPPSDPFELARRLFVEHRIEVLGQEWQGQPVLRVSFQGYNNEDDLAALVAALRDEL